MSKIILIQDLWDLEKEERTKKVFVELFDMSVTVNPTLARQAGNTLRVFYKAVIGVFNKGGGKLSQEDFFDIGFSCDWGDGIEPAKILNLIYPDYDNEVPYKESAAYIATSGKYNSKAALKEYLSA